MSEPLASAEFELAWAPHLLSTMGYTYRERPASPVITWRKSSDWRPAPRRYAEASERLFAIERQWQLWGMGRQSRPVQASDRNGVESGRSF